MKLLKIITSSTIIFILAIPNIHARNVAIERSYNDLGYPKTTIGLKKLNNVPKSANEKGYRHKPHPKAEGSHTTINQDDNGSIKSYATWVDNPKNPSGFQQQKRVDMDGLKKEGHYNKVTGKDVPHPHTHTKETPGGVRPATPDEIPSSYKKSKTNDL